MASNVECRACLCFSVALRRKALELTLHVLINVVRSVLRKPQKKISDNFRCPKERNPDKPKFKFKRRHHHSTYIELCQA
ncbi:hypothetical protein T11_4981 [Trichinella zimbabwensis]|uniref:Uncharacterized protein n=1 Tax=Trichinella zimbabwensis TaxID=268475 RepID=A0A0V1GM15_9BILA|nr:hypothetical protein T11_4981 [Trichinella zimbabwensis]